ncbi:uncharacterized protein N7515_008455 [Penicillium bovifimosum]|uniref:Integrase catalytic domain-containing protein n=1 Tax=Penicillium bovifimosum TaxID=126998 RepID=A0A9W9KXF1_9EURO|nr:uncharacterized protein N7515_008455 [Penicillium bovifimosum]KAJ5124630.1 hypothetical protein N7515_008455 [Penicillium bovifimosum]
MVYEKPFEALHWDLIHHEPSLAKTRYFSHSVDPVTKYQMGEDISDKKQTPASLLGHISFVKTQFGLDIRTIHSDNETALVSTISSEAQARGINFETAPSHQPEQNGYAERYGALITSMARQLTEDAGLPHSLWHEASRAAIYIQNRIPHHALDWKSPSEVLASHLGEKAPHWLQLKPDLSNLRVYGCKAFVRTHNIPRLAKLAPRAEIGYLVGYEASNIWRIWIPAKNRIIRARDVEFDETKFYKGEEEHSPIKLYDDSSQLISTIDDYTSSCIFDDIDIPDPSQTAQGGGMGQIDQPVPVPDENHTVPDEIHTAEDLVDQPVPVPEETQPDQDLILGDLPLSPPLEPEAECVSEPQSEVDDLFPTSPVLGKRSRSPSPSPEDEKRPRINLTAFYQAFSSNQIMPKKHMVSSIPPPPGDFSQVKSHPFRREFLQAMDVEFNKLVQMGTFEPIPSSRIRESHVRDCGDLNQKHCIKHQVLPLKWAYDYKSDEKGFVTRFKARLCVRGDLQVPDFQDARTSTLAARTFRTLIAIITTFDLDTFQMDAVNAFLNSRLDNEVYCQYPAGIGSNGKHLRLRRALYGLRIAGKRWETDIRTMLISLGFKPCPEDPCLYSDDKMIIMLFVDDFLAAYHPSESEHAFHIRDLLEQRYEMKRSGELTQFIGIRITRDRETRRTWISQGAYIEKIATKFNLLDRRTPHTPLPSDLSQVTRPAETPPDPTLVHLYQQKCGSTLFPATWTRPDTTFANQVLARSLTRCTDAHLKAVDHLISYLHGTKDLAICFDGRKQTVAFTAASDASFADNPDRKSSEGFIFSLFGGPVEWRARKQRTITTSTTEAELLALSHAARQYYWMKATLQTVDLLVSENSSFQTKLRHVDIHQLWILQEVQAKRLQIQWIDTNNMPADGLTKALTRPKHDAFIRQLGMEQIPFSPDV